VNTPDTIYRSRQLRNDEKDLEAIADAYELKLGHEYWLAEAFQKDAIQNCWDAMNTKNVKEWNAKIELLTAKNGDFVLISDSGTTGLTGTIWRTEDELATILDTKDPKENLAHFLSSNFSAKGSERGGKRGRGKSLFLISSKDSAFYFDSIRASDGLYISGGVYMGPDKGVRIEFTSGDKKHIENILGNRIIPLSVPGTRIFIKNPKQELVKALRNGSILNFIERTWWEIIKKYGAKIIVNDGSESKSASVPSWYKEGVLETKGFEVKEYPNLKLTSDQGTLPIKRIILVYNPTGETPEGIQGIAIQRRGMTIQRRATEMLVKEEGMRKVYGWVEMEKPLEKVMYNLEDVEHLSFKWTKKPAKDLLDIIRIKAREFAKEVKLIETELTKQRRAHKQIEDEVGKRINAFLKNLGFTGIASGKKKRRGLTRSSSLPLRVSLTEFNLPNDNQRVNFGDKIQAQATVINDLAIPLEMHHRTWIVDTGGKTIKIQDKKIHLHPKEKFSQGWNEILISQDEFPIGDYSFRSKIIILKDTNIELPRLGKIEKGTTIQVSAAFSVEKDPPSYGFIKFEAIESNDNTRYVSTRPENQFIVVEYNTKHPYISRFMSMDRQDELGKFLFQVGIIVALNQVLAEDISQDKPKIFKDINDDYDPTLILPRIMEEVSKFMWIQ